MVSIYDNDTAPKAPAPATTATATTANTTSTADIDAMELNSPTNDADIDRTVLYYHGDAAAV